MVRVILVKRAESGKYWRVGLPLAPGTSPGAARGGGHPVSAVMGRRRGGSARGRVPRARGNLGGVPYFLLSYLLNNIELYSNNWTYIFFE